MSSKKLTAAIVISQCPQKLWRPCRPEDWQIYLNCRSCESIACPNNWNQYNSHKLLPVQQNLQMLLLPVHPLYCQPGAEDLQISRRLYHGDIALSVNASAIFDTPAPCCGVCYHCCLMPSIHVALPWNQWNECQMIWLMVHPAVCQHGFK